ncbi:MAG: hypothetical protein KAJ73_00490 [Zetaproteobacteria bacterium]|nr:hypothetical protein [Zetaproteobacteria bacterium]
MTEGLSLLSATLKVSGVSIFTGISRDSMADEDEVAVYDYVKGYMKEYRQLPTVDTVEEETEIALPSTPEPVGFYQQQLADRDMFMSVRPMWQSMKDHLVKTDASKVRKIALDIADICTHTTVNTGLENTKALAKKSEEHFKRGKFKNELTGITTGYPLLDHETDGYQNGDLIFWVSRPGVGKTWMLLKAAHAAYMSGKKVLVVSMEMTLEQLSHRFFGYHTGIDPTYIRKGKLSHWAMKKYMDGMKDLKKSNRLHFYAGNLEKTPSGVLTVTQHLNPDIILIDGVYMMQPDEVRFRTGKNDYIGTLVDDLKKMALFTDRPVFCTSQLNRQSGARGSGGSLETIAFSDAISTHATLILNVHEPAPRRKAFELVNELGEVNTIRKLVKAKTRHVSVLKGREGDISGFQTNYSFNPPNLDIIETASDAPPEEPEQPQQGQPRRRPRQQEEQEAEPPRNDWEDDSNE